MSNDEFGFNSVAEAFRPATEEVKKQPAPKSPVARIPTAPPQLSVAPPPLPEAMPMPQAVASEPVVESPPSPITDPEFQKAALGTLLPAIAIGGAGVAYGAYQAGKRKAVQDRLIGGAPSPLGSQPVNPNLPGTPAEMQSALGPNWKEVWQKSEANRIAKQNAATQNILNQTKPGQVPNGSQSPSTQAQPVKAPPVTTPQTTQQIAQTVGVPPAPEPTVAQIAGAAAPGLQAAAQQPVDMIPPATEPKKAGRPPKGQENKATFKAGEAMPEGMVFKEGFGGADNWMKNSFNDEARIMIRDLFNEGKPYGANMDKAYADAKMYEQWLKENIPVQTYSRAERKAAGLPPPENYGKLGKAAKVAGVTGLLMTAQQAANAAQGQNRTRDLLNAIGEFFTPLSMTPSTVQPGTLGPEQLRAFEEAQKLGSPYRQAR